MKSLLLIASALIFLLSLSSCAQFVTDEEKEGWQGPSVNKNEVDYEGQHPADTRVEAFRFKKML